MSDIRLFHADCKTAMRVLIAEGVRVHSCVSDPPYGLISIIKRFGNGQAAAKAEGTDGSFGRLSKGFMGRQWDGTQIENDVEMWRLVWELLLPGGYLLAFSSPRTGHRMACAIEDAGFVMHPFIGWAYASGLPKQKNAALMIDKALGRKGTIAPRGDLPGVYVPASPEAAEWQGWAYGAQVRKPALEPVYVAQKPFSEANGARNIMKHRVGAVNIDGCRVKPENRLHAMQMSPDAGTSEIFQKSSSHNCVQSDNGSELGGYPANLMHDGSPEVQALFPEITRPVGGNASAYFNRCDSDCIGDGVDSGNIFRTLGEEIPIAENWMSADMTRNCPNPFDGYPIVFNKKAGKTDRLESSHPTVKPIALMRELVRHVTPPGGTVLDPFAGSGTTGAAAISEGMNCILIEREDEYVCDIERRLRVQTGAHAYLNVLGFET